EPSDLLRACRFAAGQSSELIQVNGLRALRSEVRVDEDLMCEFVFRIVVDVLVHIFIENRESSGVGRTSTSTRNFTVLDPSKLVVLLPQISLENFGCGQKPEN